MQPLKYLCFSHSFFDGLRKYHVQTLDSSLWKDIRNWWRKWTGTVLNKAGQSRLLIATQLKYHVWTASGEKKKVVSEVLRKYRVVVK